MLGDVLTVIRASLLAQPSGFRPLEKRNTNLNILNPIAGKVPLTTLRIVDESLVVDDVVTVLGAPTKCLKSGGRMAAKLSLSVWSSDLTLMEGLERATPPTRLADVKLLLIEDRNPLALTILDPCNSPRADPGRAARELAMDSP